MEELLLRFHHIGLQIFESLNYQNITKCREVNKLWKKFIDKEDILRFQLFMHLVKTWQKELFESFWTIRNCNKICFGDILGHSKSDLKEKLKYLQKNKHVVKKKLEKYTITCQNIEKAVKSAKKYSDPCYKFQSFKEQKVKRVLQNLELSSDSEKYKIMSNWNQDFNTKEMDIGIFYNIRISSIIEEMS